MGLAVRRSALQQTPEVIRGFLRAFLAGIRIAVEQPEVSKRAASKYFATKDPEIIDEAYKGFAPCFPGYPT
jgi:ABC-type nitrate/sulfonate/bicarbonate transport system substrate-binding protein